MHYVDRLWELYKQLEQGRLQVFDRTTAKRGAYELSSTDLALLLEGLDLRCAKRRLSRDNDNKARRVST